MIYIIKHKEWNNRVPEGYRELPVGPFGENNERYKDPGFQNINHLNPVLCEATGLYEIWKNVTDDVVGMCHYQRFFEWKGDILPLDVARDMVMNDGSIILNELENNLTYSCHDYCKWAFCNKLPVFDKYFRMMGKLDPRAATWFKHAVFFHSRTMFVCRGRDLNKICEPLFKLMIPMAERFMTEDDGKPGIDRRFLGHVCERLFSFFVERSGMTVKTLKWFDGN